MIKFLDLKSLGYAYTFNSVLAISIFLEMGFSQNLVQFVSHEFSKLKFNENGDLGGDEKSFSRLVSVGRLSFKYYGIAAVVFFAILITIGQWFLGLNDGQNSGISWRGPWILAAASGSTSLLINPFFSLMEGSNRIEYTEKIKFWSTIIGFLCTASGLIAGLGLYALSFTPLMVFAVSISYFITCHRNYFHIFLKPPKTSTVSWKKEMWPLQWRMAVSWVSGYFIFSTVTPSVFRILGAEAAGKMGFTLQVCRLIGSIASTWTTTRIPQFGMLVAGKNWHTLDSIWKNATQTALILVILGSTIMLAVFNISKPFFTEIAERYAGNTVTLLISLSVVAHTMTNCMAYYLRAFKTEPFMMLSLQNAVISTVSVIVMSSYFGLFGAASGYLVANLHLVIFGYLIFRKQRVNLKLS